MASLAQIKARLDRVEASKGKGADLAQVIVYDPAIGPPPESARTVLLLPHNGRDPLVSARR
jgi:hypothetical protein